MLLHSLNRKAGPDPLTVPTNSEPGQHSPPPSRASAAGGAFSRSFASFPFQFVEEVQKDVDVGLRLQRFRIRGDENRKAFPIWSKINAAPRHMHSHARRHHLELGPQSRLVWQK